LLAGGQEATAALNRQIAAAPSAVTAPAGGDPVLYSQIDNPAGNGVPDQDFEAVYDIYDTDAADDFVVPAGPDNWSVTQVFTPGAYTSGGVPGGPAGPAASVDITFYADNAGLPGAAVCSYPGLVPADTAGAFFTTLPTPCVLPPGTYWLGQQTNQDVLTAGQHFWSNRSVQSNAGALWRNPGDGFGTGCTTFTAPGTCGAAPGVGGGFPDQLFQIDGFLVPAQSIPAVTIPTLGTLGLLGLVLSLGGLTWWRSRHSA
jgi:hypothetical protein